MNVANKFVSNSWGKSIFNVYSPPEIQVVNTEAQQSVRRIIVISYCLTVFIKKVLILRILSITWS